MAQLIDRAGCVVFSNYNNLLYVLMVRYNNLNKFDIPRGGYDRILDKNLINCAKREVFEETGLDITNNKLFKVRQFEEWNINRKSGVKLHYNITIFTTSVRGLPKLNPVDKKEIDFAKWIEYSDAIKKLYYNIKNSEAIKSLYLAYLTGLRFKIF